MTTCGHMTHRLPSLPPPAFRHGASKCGYYTVEPNPIDIIMRQQVCYTPVGKKQLKGALVHSLVGSLCRTHHTVQQPVIVRYLNGCLKAF